MSTDGHPAVPPGGLAWEPHALDASTKALVLADGQPVMAADKTLLGCTLKLADARAFLAVVATPQGARSIGRYRRRRDAIAAIAAMIPQEA